MVLHNRVNKKELRVKVAEEHEERHVLSFYKYAKIDSPADFRDELYLKWMEFGVLGRTYVASEGINAQISVPEKTFESFREHLNSIPFLKNVRLNFAIEEDPTSFFKLAIKLRKKIVADGLDDKSFDPSNTGVHLDAPTFNELTERDDAIVVDMRNHYESEVGHFKGAITPDVDTFREALTTVEDMLQDKKDKHIIMYCTGGIRCEKASAYYKHKGFKNVYQLNGGIIEYARKADQMGIDNKFIGKNFVFDERLGERISEDIIAVCHQCGKPADSHTNCKNDGCHLLFIQCEECAEKYEGCCSEECNDIINLPEEEQKRIRKGIDKGRQVFRKGRSEKLQFMNKPIPEGEACLR